MSAKNPQNVPSLPAPVPSSYEDDLAKRCFPYRFRRIGTPYTYLDDVGITPILEFICKGNLLHDVAEAVDVPLVILKQWVEHHSYTDEIDDAETISAEGYLAEGKRRLKTAQTEFELRRAKEMIKHAQFMASKKNKPIYGDAHNIPSSSQVTYIFDLGANEKAAFKIASQVIDSTASRIVAPIAEDTPQTVVLDLGAAFGLPTHANSIAPMEMMTDEKRPSILAHLQAANLASEMPLTLEEGMRLVAARPNKPTAMAPDVGPFYEDNT